MLVPVTVALSTSPEKNVPDPIDTVAEASVELDVSLTVVPADKVVGLASSV
jgi:hypothetical protein